MHENVVKSSENKGRKRGGVEPSVQLGVATRYHHGQKLYSSQLLPDDTGSFVSMVGAGVLFQLCVHCCSNCPRETSCSLHRRPSEGSPALTGRVEI